MATPIPRRPYRRLVPVLLVLAVLTGFVGTLAVWVNRQALNTDNWTNTSSRVLADSKVQKALGTYLVGQVFSSANVSGALGQGPPQARRRARQPARLWAPWSRRPDRPGATRHRRRPARMAASEPHRPCGADADHRRRRIGRFDASGRGDARPPPALGATHRSQRLAPPGRHHVAAARGADRDHAVCPAEDGSGRRRRNSRSRGDVHDPPVRAVCARGVPCRRLAPDRPAPDRMVPPRCRNRGAARTLADRPLDRRCARRHAERAQRRDVGVADRLEHAPEHRHRARRVRRRGRARCVAHPTTGHARCCWHARARDEMLRECGLVAAASRPSHSLSPSCPRRWRSRSPRATDNRWRTRRGRSGPLARTRRSAVVADG